MRALTVALLMTSAVVGSLIGSNALSTNANVSSYDPNVAMDALFYAKSAYCDASDIADWSCPTCGFNPGMKNVSVFTERETQAYVGYDSLNNNVVVAIRGSVDFQNWIDDFTFEFVPYPACYNTNGCKVHKGFFEVYTALSVDMLPAVKSALAAHPSATLFVTGHSMGAALSILAGLDLYEHTKDRTVNVYNFGQPRVGDANFTQYAVGALPSRSQFRVTHRMDPVPHLPPLWFGFVHVPHEIFYNNDGNTSWVDCKDSYLAEDPTCSDQFPLPIGFQDHTLYLGVDVGCFTSERALAVRSHTKL